MQQLDETEQRILNELVEAQFTIDSITAGCDPETVRGIYKNILARTQKECAEKLKAINGQTDGLGCENSTIYHWRK